MNHEDVVWKNARISVVEGSFYAIMVALGESFIIPCGLYHGLSAPQIGLLATVPPCLGGLCQSITPWIEQAIDSRKLLAIFLMGLQIVGLCFIGLQAQPQFFHLMVASLLYWAGGDGIGPIWSGWMIPENPSQRITLYHANRGTCVAFVSFLFFMGGGFLKTLDSGSQLFQIFFLSAALARLTSLILLLCHTDSSLRRRQGMQEDLAELSKPLPRRVWIFGLIAALVVFRGFSGVSSPHFTQYMLKDLSFSYMTYTFLTSCGFLGRTLLLRNWIKTSHEFGSTQTLVVCCATITLVPLLWLLNHNIAWLAVIQGVAGAAWVGFDQLTLFILASLGLRHWSRYIGLLGTLGTFAAIFGGWWGGRVLESSGGMPAVICISAAGRLVATIGLGLVFRYFYRENLKPMRLIPIFFSTLSLRPSMSNINKLLWKRAPSDDA